MDPENSCNTGPWPRIPVLGSVFITNGTEIGIINFLPDSYTQKSKRPLDLDSQGSLTITFSFLMFSLDKVN